MTEDCKGVATLTAMGRRLSYGRSGFSVQGRKTTHVHIRISHRMMGLVRTHRGGVFATLSAVVQGKIVTQTIGVKIY